MRLRCWARHVSDNALCEREHEAEMRHIHVGGHPHHDHDVTWLDEYCARDAGPSGRETAALRILGVAHEIDRIAFQCGETIGEYDALRAIASRLYCNTIAASADLLSVEDALNGLEIDSEATEQERQSAEETIALIRQAADILRPFAESK